MDKTKYIAFLKGKGNKIVNYALEYYGLREIKGAKHEAKILEMFRVANAAWIKDDETAWCGAYVGYVFKKMGYDIPKVAVRASEWGNWGTPVKVAELGDILVFTRSGGGHVGMYVGEDDKNYYVLGGNQSDEVNIAKLAKTRLTAIRRAVGDNEPKGVIKVEGADFKYSTNER